MQTKKDTKNIIKKMFQIAPWILILIFGVFSFIFLINGNDITPQELLQYTPKNTYLAAVFLIFLFALKSLVFVFPIPVLYICSTLIFKPFTALIVNVLGMLACTIVPYWIGRVSGTEFVDKMISRHPRIKLLESYKNENQWFFSFIVRAIGFLPCDAVSIILGALKIKFRKYVGGTTVGMFPGLIATTLLGITITNPRSPEFVLSCIFTVIVSIGSVFVYRLTVKSRMKQVP